MTAHSLTQSRLKELLHYNLDTGVFTWLVFRGRVKSGSVAGTINGAGYIHIGVYGTNHLAHRLAFLYVEGTFPPHQVDHKNHIRSDNVWSNLRHATHLDNDKNHSKQANNTSGTTGVCWYKRTSKWKVYIGTKTRVNGGYFTDKQEAITKRKQLEKEHNYHKNHGT